MTLTVNNVSKRFSDVQALAGVTFSATGGKPLGLLGRNGAGKTTAMRIIMDIFEADSGEVLLDGQRISRSKLRLGYLPEERGLYRKITVGEQLCYFARLRGLSRTDAQTAATKWLERLGMSETAKSKVETLSKGNQQRIQLALALINDPEVVILDEPFSGLDPVNAMQLRAVVNETAKRGSIVIFSSHQMSSVEDFCDDIVILKKGNIVLGGRLPDIRAGYPRDRIRIVAADGSDDEARRLSASFGAVSDSREGFCVRLEEEDRRKALLGALLEGGVDIVTFETVEPSLEEIFVGVAGNDEDEAQTENGGERA